ncbi:MAG: YeiH family protein [Castellaniella sp.]|uniref:YeiH family protein n=1 Tax=Castellaniella sp. TaxID=1955812 RepID=UPI002A366F3E|nr:YeiH family protein [Castellaniella sp.]MDY0308184.1 YeiH family protein [Castellaniella sp.]
MLPISAVPHPLPSAASRPAVQASPHGGSSRAPSLWYGLLLAAGLGLAAWWLGARFPLIGGPVFGILLGMLWRNVLGLSPIFVPGVVFSSRQVLKWSIIGLGFGLSFGQVMKTGASSLAVTLITLSTAFLAAWLLGRWLELSGGLRTLIGIGTAICGGSAIAAVAPIIKPDDHETALSISTIFLFNIVAVLLFPPLGHWMGLSDHGFGLWAGTAINDTSSVVAAGYSYSAAAGDIATVVKLTRATLIIPICIAIAFWTAWRNQHSETRVSLATIFPWFILWFLVASATRSLGLIPDALLEPLNLLSQFLIIMALTAIGLSSDLRHMALAGTRPLLLGLGVWAAVSLSSLGVQWLVGQI